MNATCPDCGAKIDPREGCRKCMMRLALVPTAPGADDDPSLAPGTAFRGLEILQEVGRGGMGVVYKARQLDLDRTVALKVLAPDLAGDPEFAGRFDREAKALAALNHSNIVHVHDFGREAGRLFLIMEYVDGVSLRELMRQRRLAPAEALRIVPQICDALQYAHDMGVVHRDIKPENILIDRQGRVKIADFGLAKLTRKGDAVATRTNAVMGTPHYMAPEQVESLKGVDHRADIYSLGVVFYEMLTGELPMGRFEPPSQRIQLDVRLDEIVLKALEKRPTRRYQRAAQVKTDIETVLTRPAANAPATSLRRRLLIAGIIVVIAVTGLDFGLTRTISKLQPPVWLGILALFGGSLFALASRGRGALRAFFKGAAIMVAIPGTISFVIMAILFQDPTEFDRLLTQLASDDIQARDQAAEEIAKLGQTDQAVHQRVLAERDRSTDPEVRTRLDHVATEIDFRRAAAIEFKQEARIASRSGSGGSPKALAASPDGKHLAVWGSDHRLMLLDAGDLREVGVLKRTQKPVECLAFAPDGQSLALAEEDSLVLLEVPSGQELRRWTLAVGPEGLSFSSDGRQLLEWSLGGARLWDVRTGTQVQTLNPGNGCQAAALSPDGALVAALSWSGNLTVWNAKDGEQQLRKESPEPLEAGFGPRLTFAPDGKHVAYLVCSLTAAKTQLVMIDVETGTEKWRLSLTDKDSRSWLSSAGGYIAIMTNDVELRSWQDGRALGTCTSAVESFSWSPDAEHFFIATKEGLSKVQASTTKVVRKATPSQGRLRETAFLPNGKTLLVLDETMLRFWDWRHGQEDRAFVVGDAAGWATSPDGTHLIVDKKLLDLRTGNLLSGWDLSEAERFAFTPDGQLIAGEEDGDIRVFNLATKTCIRSLDSPKTFEAVVRTADYTGKMSTSSPQIDVSFSADGHTAARLYVSPLPKHALDFVDLQRGERLSVVDREQVTEGVSGASLATLMMVGGSQCALSPDGRHAYYANKVGKIKMIDTATGQVTLTVGPVTPVHDAPDAMALDPSGRYLAISYGAEPAVLLHAATLRQIATFPATDDAESDPVKGLVFNQDGTLLALRRTHSVTVVRLAPR
ncbi:MAG: protein kinase [Planctomycetes bacterium]|nr:protein kinase [Planctomycetota bacterium]